MRWLKLLIGLVVGLLFGWITARFLLNRRQAASEEAVFELRSTPREQPPTTPAENVSDAADVETQIVETATVGKNQLVGTRSKMAKIETSPAPTSVQKSGRSTK